LIHNFAPPIKKKFGEDLTKEGEGFGEAGIAKRHAQAKRQALESGSGERKNINGEKKCWEKESWDSEVPPQTTLEKNYNSSSAWEGFVK